MFDLKILKRRGKGNIHELVLHLINLFEGGWVTIVLMIDKKTHIFIIPIVPYNPLGFWCPNFLDLGLPHLMLPSFPLDGQLATLNSLIMINKISTHFFSQTIVKRGMCFDDVKDEKTVNNCSPGNNLMQLIKRPDYKNTICMFIFHSVFHFWSP